MDRLELKIPPPLLCLLLAGLMYLLAAAGIDIRLPGASILTALLALSGAALLLSGVAAFVRAHTSVNPLRPESASVLVTSGLYRFSRNPMYLGDLLLLGAWALYLGQLLPLLGLPLFVLYMNRFQIRPEERALSHQFGAAYQDYCQRVRRWI